MKVLPHKLELYRALYDHEEQRTARTDQLIQSSFASCLVLLGALYFLASNAPNVLPWWGVLTLAVSGGLAVSGAGFLVRAQWNIRYKEAPDLLEVEAWEDHQRKRGVSEQAIEAAFIDGFLARFAVATSRNALANDARIRIRWHGVQLLIGSFAALVLSSIAVLLSSE